MEGNVIESCNESEHFLVILQKLYWKKILSIPVSPQILIMKAFEVISAGIIMFVKGHREKDSQC